MKRADVKIGQEYAVRRGRYGTVAHVAILKEKTVEAHRTAAGGFGSYRAEEKGFEARLISGDYVPGNGIPRLREAEKVGFVRPRDVLMDWPAWETAHAESLALEQARRTAKEGAKAEYDELEQRIRVVAGVPDFELPTWRRTDPRIELERPMLRLLLVMAERNGAEAIKAFVAAVKREQPWKGLADADEAELTRWTETALSEITGS